ncbi:hypothetical protein [Emticicia sp. 17c]|uniref:hypothetical protein n=1 Tax=Emticicia sp. 17c TaxID=3127704 RepID=UPI00301E3EBA
MIKEIKPDYSLIRQRIEQTIKEKGISKQKFCSDLGFSRQSFYQFFYNESMNVNYLFTIANYIGKPISFLIGETDLDTIKISESKNEANNEYKDKYLKAVELLALNGIRLDLGKTNGVLEMAICNIINKNFFGNNTHILTLH